MPSIPSRRLGRKLSTGTSSERGSAGSYPAIAANPRATSVTLYASIPMVSACTLKAKALVLGMRPTVGLIPATPQNDAGLRTEPPVSEPNAMRHIPAAAAAPAPPLDPPDTRFKSQGFRQLPK